MNRVGVPVELHTCTAHINLISRTQEHIGTAPEQLCSGAQIIVTRSNELLEHAPEHALEQCSGALMITPCYGALKILTAPEYAAPEQSEKCCSYALLISDVMTQKKLI
jgi:hypothetical protein